MGKAQLISPTFWVRVVHPYLVRYARRGPLLAYIASEIIVDIGIGLFYFFLHNVALMRQNWYVWYLIASAVRIILALIGAYGVWSRKLQTVRMFFLIFIFNVMLVGWSWIPVMHLRCWCDNFRDCQALTSFTTVDKQFVNRETPLSDKMARLVGSHVRVQNEPHRGSPETEETFMARSSVSGVLLQFNAGLRSNASTEHRLQAWHVVDTATGASSRELRQRHSRSQTRGDSSSSGAGVRRDGVQRRAIDRRAAALRVISWWRTRAMWLKSQEVEASESSFIDSFYFGPDGAAWVPGAFGGTDELSCHHDVMGSPLEILILRSKLEEARWTTWKKQRTQVDMANPKIAKVLKDCFDEVDCRSISVRLDPMTPEGTAKLQVCKQVGSSKVVPAEKSGEHADFSITLRRKTLPESEDAAPAQPLYSLNFKLRDTEDGMNTLASAVETACVCDKDDQRNCIRDEGTFGRNFWCYVSTKSVSQCLQSGYKVFFDTKQGKHWTSDICSPPTCTCSGLGMKPPTGKEVSKSVDMWSNKLNYGQHCDKWNEDGKRWCFVGFDSTCADRGPRQTYQNTDPAWSSLPLQFGSQIPCIDEADQAAALKSARTKCIAARVVFHFTILLHLMLRLAIAAMLHIFIANRCTDSVEVEEQFKISWSDDDDEDWAGPEKSKQDDVDVDDSKPRKSKKSITFDGLPDD